MIETKGWLIGAKLKDYEKHGYLLFVTEESDNIYGDEFYLENKSDLPENMSDEDMLTIIITDKEAALKYFIDYYKYYTGEGVLQAVMNEYFNCGIDGLEVIELHGNADDKSILFLNMDEEQFLSIEEYEVYAENKFIVNNNMDNAKVYTLFRNDTGVNIAVEINQNIFEPFKSYKISEINEVLNKSLIDYVNGFEFIPNYLYMLYKK